MKENRVQFDLTIWFSQQYPEFHGLLFEINNDTYSVQHAMKRRAMGMIKGAADLAFIIPYKGIFCGIELKAPKSSHKKSHIENQVFWGKKIIAQGGFYLITSDIVIAKKFIINLIGQKYHKAEDLQFESIQLVLSQFKSNYIKF